MSSQRASNGMIRVWDPLLRILHWTLAGSIAVTFVTGDEAKLEDELRGRPSEK